MAAAPDDVIVLLRGINVGGKNKLPMADLRAIVAEAGYDDPVTYLQSGNLILRGVASSRTSKVAGAVHDAIEAATGLDIAIITRTATEWAAIVDDNPFPDAAADGTKLHLIVLDGRASARVSSFDASPFAPEELYVAERELYLSLPDGIGRSKLAASIVRVDNARGGTARNWKSVLALAELVAS